MVKEEGWIKCDSPFYSALIAMVYNAYRWVWITLIMRHLKDHAVFKTSVPKEATPLPMITIMALQKGCPEAQDSAVPRDPAQVPGPRLPRPLPRHQLVYGNRGQRLPGPRLGTHSASTRLLSTAAFSSFSWFSFSCIWMVSRSEACVERREGRWAGRGLRAPACPAHPL